MLACMGGGYMPSPLALNFISATTKALGHNIKDIILNCTSMHHGKELIENFKIPETFVLHWDGKQLSAITGKDKVDRLATVLTSNNVEILIIEYGAGLAAA